jgi:hypothetical protein
MKKFRPWLLAGWLLNVVLYTCTGGHEAFIAAVAGFFVCHNMHILLGNVTESGDDDEDPDEDSITGPLPNPIAHDNSH